MLNKELEIKANKISEMLEENFMNELLNAKSINNYLNIALFSSKNTEDLLNQYIEKNKILKLKLRESHGDILTNDRKTYYETEALNSLQIWYNIFWIMYYFFVLILILAFAFSPSVMDVFSNSNYSISNFMKKIIIIVLFVFYPYYIDYVVRWIYGFIKNIVSRMPKNVYNDL
jgi:magnesium-transporting ATPase (P-type)